MKKRNTKQILSSRDETQLISRNNAKKCIDTLIVDNSYVSSDPLALVDTDIREYGHLTRISDEAATFFYRLHAAVKSYFFKGRVTRGTPGRAELEILNRDDIVIFLQAALPDQPLDAVKGIIIMYAMNLNEIT